MSVRRLVVAERRDKMKHIDVMYKVKPVQKMPVLDVMSRQMVEEYFEVPTTVINSYCSNHSFELEEYGAIKLKVNDFINAGYETKPCNINGFKLMCYGDSQIKVGNTGICCLSESAMFNIALGLQNSPVARKIRDMVKAEEKRSQTELIFGDKPLVEEQIQDNGIQMFSSSDFGSIRVIVINSVPWFVGKEIAMALGYGKGKSLNNAVANHVDKDDKGVTEMMTPGGKQKVTIINESGLYSLILSSKLLSAKKFKNWVTREVLPSIRKHGAYLTPQTLEAALQNPDSLILILQKLKAEQEKNKALQNKVEHLAMTNKVLSDEINLWDKKSVLNALMRSYGANHFNGQFQYAYSDFYKQLKYKHHIDLKLRQSKGKKTARPIDLIHEDEMDDALRLAVAICEDNGINTGKVINEVNAGRYVE